MSVSGLGLKVVGKYLMYINIRKLILKNSINSSKMQKYYVNSLDKYILEISYELEKYKD